MVSTVSCQQSRGGKSLDKKPHTPEDRPLVRPNPKEKRKRKPLLHSKYEIYLSHNITYFSTGNKILNLN